MKIGIVGDSTWTQLRELIINKLEECKTETQMSTFLALIMASIGTKEEIISRRKKLGLPIDKKFLEQMKKAKEGKPSNGS